MDRLRMQIFHVVILVDDTAVTLKMSKNSQYFNPKDVDIWDTKRQVGRVAFFFFNLKKLKVVDVGQLGNYLTHPDL